MTTFSRDQILEAFQKLPSPVRQYLASDELYTFVENIGQKHSLHIDTVGGLSKTAGYLLCGLMNPAQFQNELQTLGITPIEATAIIQELNEKVFKPLQEKIRNAPPEEPEEPEEAFVPAPTPPAPKQASSAATPLIPPPAVAMQNPPMPRPQVATPVPQPIGPAPQPQAAPRQISAPAPRPEIAPTYVPPNLPGAQNLDIPRAPAPQTPIPPQVPKPAQPAPAPKNEALHEVLKGYGVDPYREPLE